MIHFNDDSICYGVDAETLCLLTHKHIFNNTTDEIYYKSVNSVNCPDCRYRLIREGRIFRTRLELIT